MQTLRWVQEFAVNCDGDMVVRLRDRRIVQGLHFESLAEIFRICRCKNLRLDFSDVEFLSRTAVGKLLELNKQIHARDGSLILYGLSADLHEMMRLCKLDSLLTIQDEDQEDLRAFRSLSYT